MNYRAMWKIHILFGRERALGGIPPETTSACDEAAQLVKIMIQLDRVATECINSVHPEQMDEISWNRGHKRGWKAAD